MKKILKSAYSGAENWLATRSIALYKTKTAIAEQRGILHKKRIYHDVKWSTEQEKAFRDYSQRVFGKVISDRWHKLYEAVSGRFCVEYVPEKLYTVKIEPAMNDYLYTKGLEDKSILESLCSHSAVTFPKTVMVCSGGRFYNEKRIPITEDAAIDCICSTEDVVMKPTAGSSSGRNIRFIEKPAEMTRGEIAAFFDEMKPNFIVQHRIIPNQVFSSFNPDSVNTLRVITFIADGSIHCAPISFRIGRSGKRVDNIHSGGIVVGVNEDGSLLPQGYLLGYGDSKQKFDAHPDTGMVFQGVVLPEVPEIVKAAEELHGRFPHLGIISWDFTVNSEGKPVLIEVNLRGQSVWFPQMVHGKGVFGEYLPTILKENSVCI